MTFEEVLLEYIGTAADAWDIRAVVRRCFFYDFDGVPTRLWDGVGRLVTTVGVGDPLTLPDGSVLAANEWIGTIGPDKVNHHSTPDIGDDRDGKAPVYAFSLPYLGAETFGALKLDQDKAAGRLLTCYRAIFLHGEGLRPQTPISFSYRLTMESVDFSDAPLVADGGSVKRQYGATVNCRSGEAGRSRYPGGTYTDTSQRERARVLGVSSDSGCVFVAKNTSRTITRGA